MSIGFTRNAPFTALAAALAALAILAALATIAAPTQAAAPYVSDERIAGADRYDTAAEIGDEFYVSQGGRSSVHDTVIVASGLDKHFAYAIAAPGLARRHRAPLLLTEPDGLPSDTSRFITDNSIDEVIIIGDTDAVSSDTQRAIDRLDGVSVSRIAGDDIYETAVLVARQVGPTAGTPGRYGSFGPTAILATGASFADALAAGPLAYRGQHPILLTEPDRLPTDVADFLRRTDTDHVLILGGTAAISADVEAEVRRVGPTTERLAGADRFATAVEIAKELLRSNRPEPCFEGSEFGLANGWKSPDALASAALLGDKCAPLLLTDLDELPAVTAEFLESGKYATGDSFGDIRLTVFGGTAAVAGSAAAAAVNAARLDAISARISAIEGRCEFTVSFDEPVRTADAESADSYLIDSRSLASGTIIDAGLAETTTRAVVTLGPASVLVPGGMAVGCREPLVARQAIEIRQGAIGTITDSRTVRQLSFRISSDRSLPRLILTALEGARTVFIQANEPLDFVDSTDSEVCFQRGSETATCETFAVGDGALRYNIDVPFSAPFNGTLAAGDVVTIAARSVQDLAGNRNTVVTITTRKDVIAPRVQRVTVSELTGRNPAMVEIDGRHSQQSYALSDALRIESRPTGEAAGAEGNGWELTLRIDRESPATRRSEVELDTAARTIAIELSSTRTLRNLAADLNDDESFAAHFEAIVDHISYYGAVLHPDARSYMFSGGTSAVDLTVYWSEPVRGCDAAQGAVLPGLIEVDANADGRYDYHLDGSVADAYAVTFTDAPDGNPSIIAGAAACDTSPNEAQGTLVARLESAWPASLPDLSSSLIIRQGAATDIKGNESVNRRFDAISRP